MFWRKCSEELPKVEERVLCFSERGGQFVGYHKEERFKHCAKVLFRVPGTKNAKLATHWMYLPKDPTFFNQL